ncbi:hypothetical protein OJ997_08700 [Solirubrobacter phytolaccae]|uniref:CBM-cenC domain-containing protein n=1 Tax=Solirubrobacter phytolaccae TaxID=1404360 RepID=A0A9X3N5Y6_9ACTN|nr:hypothetical protein [Solirubrobacter phytolaccae]MDA0180373.1 hypothetical protein [Solirubrobacter phytolaccae]
MLTFRKRGVSVALFAAALAASATSAQAATIHKINPSCGWNAGSYACSQTFTATGGVHGWDIESTRPIEVTAIGARGGRAGNGTGGGLGGEVKTTTRYADLCLTIAGAGGDANGPTGGGGGANGGGWGGHGPDGKGGGGGGGATTVRESPYYDPCRVPGGTLVATGPGGGGGAPSNVGGDAGANAPGGVDGCGGGAGKAPSGGRGGTNCSGGSYNGSAGTVGQGGNGGEGSAGQCVRYECMMPQYQFSGGGGGGGGVYGGGGGGSPKSVSRGGLNGGAGGGGGGSGSGSVKTSTALPSVTLTWYPPNPPSMLTNGSFEEPALPANSWDLRTNVPGWTDVNGRPIELQSYAGAASGKQYIEIDANEGSSLKATFPSAAYTQYRITFKYAARPGLGADQNRLYFAAYHWVGAPQLEGVLTADGTGRSTPEWKEFSGVFMAHNNQSTIVLREDGPSNGVGMFVDDFSVTPIG